MNKSTRIATSIIGVYAGILGIIHGYFEIQQGTVVVTGIMVNAIGIPCQPNTVWHACLPAMTFLPNFLSSGIAAVIISFIALIWAAAFIQRKHGNLVLILLSVLMLIFGAGFVPSYTAIIAGIFAAQIHARISLQTTLVTKNILGLLSWFRLLTLAAFLIWSIGGWILGYFFNDVMINLSTFLFLFCDIGLPLFAVITDLAYDIQHHNSIQ